MIAPACTWSQEKERLALNVDELNDIVFSKTFQPPSAWADRERKYKMEKRDWETEVSAGLYTLYPPPCRSPQQPHG